MAATWMTVWTPHIANLVFATTFKGKVKDPQHLDFETKITEFDDKSKDKIKVFCSSTRLDPYHFTIVIDTIKCPFSIVGCYANLQRSIFDEIVKTLEEEIIAKKWQTKKGEALKAKPLANAESCGCDGRCSRCREGETHYTPEGACWFESDGNQKLSTKPSIHTGSIRCTNRHLEQSQEVSPMSALPSKKRSYDKR